MSGSKKLWQWCWMPATVFFLGTLSVGLLVWTNQLIEKKRIGFIVTDAIMEVQIHTSGFHLWLEEFLAGDPEAEVQHFWPEITQAVTLVDAYLLGGETEHGLISEPLRDPEQRAYAARIKSLLLEFQEVALERLNEPSGSGIGSALDKQFDGLFKKILAEASALERIVTAEKIRHEAEAKRLFWSILFVWASILTVATSGLLRLERQRKASDDALHAANNRLTIQAEELTEHREHLSKLVEQRTEELTTANELLQGKIEEQTQAEKQIRRLSSQLLTAQEVERRRISMGLHDELGQALNVAKLEIRGIERGLKEDQRAAREDCEKLLEYMDEVIENVRRLSLCLSPTILEDLGLTSALKWLVSGISKDPNMKITSEIQQIDHLIPKDQWITAYRVVQEALTNIGRHAHAENVSLAVRTRGDKVIFSVEDDGKGFDPREAAARDATEKGLGLATMDERVRMMGGAFNISSQMGKGTRIDFSIPIVMKKLEIRN